MSPLLTGGPKVAAVSLSLGKIMPVSNGKAHLLGSGRVHLLAKNSHQEQWAGRSLVDLQPPWALQTRPSLFAMRVTLSTSQTHGPSKPENPIIPSEILA